MSWNFDARAVEPGSGFEIWPDGWWPVVITGAEEKPNTGDDPGMTWHLAIRGLDGAVKDKKHTIQIAHKSGNQQRMDIAMKTMSAICHVVNVLAFQHPGQLANIPFMVKSGTRKGKGENADKVYQDWADFKNMAGETAVDIYKRMNGQGGGAPAQQGQPAQGGGWGGQPQQPAQGGQWGGQPPAQQQQPANGPGGQGWPQGGQQQPAMQPQQPPQQPPQQQWGQQPQQGQQPPMQQPPAQGGWGGGAPTQPAQQGQPAQQWQPQPGQGGGPAPGAAPWGPQGQQG